ncbi:MAG: hypothetical protein ACRYG4_07625 [Janthinobacterium lividum]
MRPVGSIFSGVPAVPFCMSVGVTGHRSAALDGADGLRLRERLDHVLGALRDAAVHLHVAEASVFAEVALAPRLICPLAEGADQLAAASALALGYELHAILPFPGHEYAGDFTDPAALALFEGLLGQATRLLELPCDRGEAPSAYALAGRATVAHSDIMIAVWDGLPARGPGGTAEVVEHALRRGTPVVHIPVDAAMPTRLIWSGHDPHLAQSRVDEYSSRDFDDFGFDSLVRGLLAPPDDPVERAHLAAFRGEHERRIKGRVEYPLLLAATGSRPLRRTSFLVAPYVADARPEWQAFAAQARGLSGELPAGDQIWQVAYAWSDRLAAHFAQNYRSGHVFNFLFGALAVLLGLSGLLLPGLKLWLAFAELAVIGAFVLNTRVGVAQNWHRRWLDYRQLAERLRPMGSLTLVGIAQPDLRAASRGAQSWVDWYAAGIWRSIGMPTGRLTRDTNALSRLIVNENILPQVAYNRSSGAVVSHLDHRLHQAGTMLFTVSCLSCIAFILSYLVNHAWTVAHAAAFVATSAGLPAVGTAFFGIRVQGDFAGTAARARVTADHLAAIAAALEGDHTSLSRTADGIEAAARAMLADLGEWRLSHQQRQLELG